MLGSNNKDQQPKPSQDLTDAQKTALRVWYNGSEEKKERDGIKERKHQKRIAFERELIAKGVYVDDMYSDPDWDRLCVKEDGTPYDHGKDINPNDGEDSNFE